MEKAQIAVGLLWAPVFFVALGMPMPLAIGAYVVVLLVAFRTLRYLNGDSR